MRTLSVALTGGIGSGKSLICKVFEALGRKVFVSDRVAKTLYFRQDVKAKMQEFFGNDIYINNVLDAAKLSSLVFNDKDKLLWLNNLIHPLVKQSYKAFLSDAQSRGENYVLLESAIVFESSWEDMFDKIICVSTPWDLVLERTQLRDNTDRQSVERRISSQMPQQEKEAKSDCIIINDDRELVVPQIIKIDKELKELSLNGYKNLD